MPVTSAKPGARPSKTINIGFNEGTIAEFAAAVLLCGAVVWAARGPNVEKTDFSVTYLGARIIYQGQGAKLYDLREQASLKSSLFARAEPLIYEHPPFEAFFLAPLAGLPYRRAYLIWGLVNVLIWLVLPYVLRPYALVPRDALGYLALWILFAPLGIALYQGQSSLLLLLLYALTFISLKRGHDFRAGLSLGLGLFKFQFVLPFALIFVFRRKWKLLEGFALTATLLGAVSLAAVGWQGLLSYVHLLLNIAGNPDNLSYGAVTDMASLQGFVHAILGRRVGPAIVRLMVAAVSLFLVLLIAWRWRQENTEDFFDIMFAVALVVSLVTGFHMFLHDMSPLILALLLVCAHFPGRDRPGLRLALRTTLVLFWIPPLYFVLLARHRVYLEFPLLMVFAFAALRLAENSADATELLSQCF
jgi:hypothetical protein